MSAVEHDFRPVRRVFREGSRYAGACSCGWDDGEHFALESSAYEAHDEHVESLAGTLVRAV